MTKKMLKKFLALMVAFVMLSQSTLAPVALSIRSNVTAATIHDLLSALEDVTLTVTTPEISVVHETNVPYDGYNDVTLALGPDQCNATILSPENVMDKNIVYNIQAQVQRRDDVELSTLGRVFTGAYIADAEVTLDFNNRVLELLGFVNRHDGSTIEPSVATQSVVWSNDVDTQQEALLAARFRVANISHLDPTETAITISEILLENESGRELPVEVADNPFTFEMLVVSGDVDFNNTINNADIMRIQQLIANPNNPNLVADRRAADVFQDGIINVRDVQTLQQYLNPNVHTVTALPVIPPTANMMPFGFTPFSVDTPMVMPADIRMAINPTNVRNEFEAVVSITNNPGISAYHMVMAFDNYALTPISFRYGNAFASEDAMFMSSLMWIENEAERAELNEVTAVWSALHNAYEDGMLFTVRFRLNAGAPSATVTLNGVDVLGHDATNGFEIAYVATNLCDAPYATAIVFGMSRNVNTDQINTDPSSSMMYQ